jgi:4-alpha-glucanotransferase
MRTSGILCHISSLPSPYGIGTYGKKAYEFVDFLVNAKQTYWQILPLGPTSYGDSPYQTFSAFANNPYFIDLDMLINDGLLSSDEISDIVKNPKYVDYESLYDRRYVTLRCAYSRFNKDSESFLSFLNKESYWLNDYALFMAIKSDHEGKSWLYWDQDLRLRKPHALEKAAQLLKEEIDFQKFLQYKAYQQWDLLKAYANNKGIKIVGDMPIYVSYDSSDVWANPSMFQLDANNVPTHVAGVPPDNYATDGQLWGNPLYHWDHLEETNYQWWIDRVKASIQMFDMIRIDHFIGFVNFYSIPYKDINARKGVWIKGPGKKVFDAIKQTLGDVPIIAEDLGVVTPEVRKVLEDVGYPGMKLLQFGFDASEDSEYLPHHYHENIVAYTGTHDNMTSASWFESLSKENLEFALSYMNCCETQDHVECLIKETLKCHANTAIIPIQDYLHLKDDGRMNIPSTLGNNWQWRLVEDQLNKSLGKHIAKLTKLYRRDRK